MFLLTNSEIVRKTLHAIMIKKFCLMVNKRTLRSTKLKKNIFSLKNVKNSERNLRNQLIVYDARNACRMTDTGTSPCVITLAQY